MPSRTALPVVQNLSETHCTRYKIKRSKFVGQELREMWRQPFRVTIQGWTTFPFPGSVNSVPAVVYHFCLNLPEKFSQPGNGMLAQLDYWKSCNPGRQWSLSCGGRASDP